MSGFNSVTLGFIGSLYDFEVYPNIRNRIAQRVDYSCNKRIFKSFSNNMILVVTRKFWTNIFPVFFNPIKNQRGANAVEQLRINGGYT